MNDPLTHRQVEIGDSSLHVVQAGPSDGPAVVFLHGWPESWHTWREVLPLAATDGYRAVALDLPGIGRSTGAATDGTTAALAAVVHELAAVLGLGTHAVVGRDLGGMIAYPYLRSYAGAVTKVVIGNVSVPGVEPWSETVRNPYIWHFAFHSIPQLPETLVADHRREYFDFFFDALSPEPDRIGAEVRESAVEAYSRPAALRAGFAWYRGFAADAEVNAGFTAGNDVPLLYLRGTGEGGELDTYLDGFRSAGLTDVRGATVEGGHFLADENPSGLWTTIARFLAEPVTVH